MVTITQGNRVSTGKVGDRVILVDGEHMTPKLYFIKDMDELIKQLAVDLPDMDPDEFQLTDLGIVTDDDMRAKIAMEISTELIAALENCACMGSQANRPGPGVTTYVQRMHAMIISMITKK